MSTSRASFSQRTDKPEWVRLRAGTVDTDFTPALTYHIHYDSRVSWYEPEDECERFAEGKPQ